MQSSPQKTNTPSKLGTPITPSEVGTPLESTKTPGSIPSSPPDRKIIINDSSSTSPTSEDSEKQGKTSHNEDEDESGGTSPFESNRQLPDDENILNSSDRNSDNPTYVASPTNSKDLIGQSSALSSSSSPTSSALRSSPSQIQASSPTN